MSDPYFDPIWADINSPNNPYAQLDPPANRPAALADILALLGPKASNQALLPSTSTVPQVKPAPASGVMPMLLIGGAALAVILLIQD